MKPLIVLLLISLYLFSSCEKDPLRADLSGKWVEKSLMKDTILFDSPVFDFGENWFELRRDVKLSTGPYEYKLFGDSIAIRWMLSSCLYCQPGRR